MTRVVRDEVAGVTVCRFCGRRIVWAETEARRRMPIDVEPVPDGLWVVWHYEEEEPVPTNRVSYAPLHGEGERYEGPRWTAHWATCPQRERARRDPAEMDTPSPQLELFGVMRGPGGRTVH